MTRLIDADQFISELEDLYKQAGWGRREIHFSLADVASNIEMIPTAEAIPIEWMRKYIQKHPFALAYGMAEAWMTGKEE